MKFIQNALLFALLPSTFGLRGAQEHRNLEGVLVDDSPTKNTTTRTIPLYYRLRSGQPVCRHCRLV